MPTARELAVAIAPDRAVFVKIPESERNLQPSDERAGGKRRLSFGRRLAILQKRA
jgi:hypothetical protein